MTLPSKTLSNGTSVPRPRRSRAIWGVAAALWLGALCVGMAAMLRYELTPGDDTGAPKFWPSASSLPRTAGKQTLVVLAHPRCPCTEATMQEIAEAVARSRLEATVLVAFFMPADAGEAWTRTAAWAGAAAIPGAIIFKDESGQEAKRFHAATSGRTLLYGTHGELLFEGGVTGARGMVGENAGQNALIALLSHQAATTPTAPVFGCRINSTCQQ